MSKVTPMKGKENATINVNRLAIIKIKVMLRYRPRSLLARVRAMFPMLEKKTLTPKISPTIGKLISRPFT